MATPNCSGPNSAANLQPGTAGAAAVEDARPNTLPQTLSAERVAILLNRIAMCLSDAWSALDGKGTTAEEIAALALIRQAGALADSGCHACTGAWVIGDAAEWFGTTDNYLDLARGAA